MGQTPKVRQSLERIYSRLDDALLTSDETPLSEAALGLAAKDRSRLALGTYSRDGLQRALTAYGTLSRLEAKGLGRLDVRLDLEDPFRPRITLWSLRHDAPAVDVRVRQVFGAQLSLPQEVADVPVLFLEDVVLEHPGRKLSWARPPLPGQRRPGLAMSSEILELLLLMARRIGAEAMALVPNTFFAAWAYRDYFSFVDPLAAGRFDALRSTTRLRSLWWVSWGLELGCVRDAEGKVVAFLPSPMVAPMTARVGRFLSTRRYQRDRASAAGVRYELDLPFLRARFPWGQMPPGPPPLPLRLLLGDRP